jgi:hypothetical protein
MIPSDPILPLASLARPPRADLPPPLDRPGVRLFGYGREALREGLRRLGLEPGDNVLLPAFICDAAVAPLHALALEPRFYEVDERLDPVLPAARRLIDGRSRAFVAVNYFGFPQDLDALRRFCREGGLAFIEDNTHGFLSRRADGWLGTFGDIGILSPRKTLPLPNGAALLLNAASAGSGPDAQARGGTLADTPVFLLKTLLRRVEADTGIPVVAPARRMLRLARRQDAAEDPSEEFLDERWRVPFSPFALAMMRRIDLAAAAATRREVFAYWRRYVMERWRGAAEPLFTDLPEGVVPYAFPLLARQPLALPRALAEIGVEAWLWPNLPRRSPGWRRADKLLLIPVHSFPAQIQ